MAEPKPSGEPVYLGPRHGLGLASYGDGPLPPPDGTTFSIAADDVDPQASRWLGVVIAVWVIVGLAVSIGWLVTRS